MEMEKATDNKALQLVKKFFQRYFIDAMSAMALGLFSSLIIGLIMSQLSKIPFLSFLEPYSAMAAASSPVVGSAIGAAIAWGLKSKPLVVFSCVVCGAFGYQAGGPVGAYVAAVVGAELARLVSGKTKVDIVVTPMVTIITGSIAGQLVGPYIQSFMSGLGAVINHATELSPLPMGILVSAIVGMVLTAPISSAALCIMLDLNGLAAGAAVVGCSAQMIGFAVASFRENKWGGLLSQGIGTSMLQFSNIMRKPQIWIAPTLASAILGPISTCVFQMTNTATGAGMGTSGLVGQFGAFAAMSGTMPQWQIWVEVLLMHFIAPAILTLIIDFALRKIGWIKEGDMKINV
ncbi:PTS transporter subunit IIC [Anaeromassilibacillus senegalensis]|uniref:PTS transporter subunit IIC n=1 Tax=Anaeromassilibacillus senegalensis TaxID=1673717 RepID=UPI000AFFF70D|nr:PTS sugar transporter subunit IIC [Anaeromassilibacillus senegalensis]